MRESLGARLRQQREQQAIALLTIAEQTKIKPSLLEALERDDVSQWPSGIFRRAFIRAYAHAIGLDPDLVVREFLEVYPDPIEAIVPIPAIASGDERPRMSGGPPTRLRYIVGSAIESLSRLRRSPAADDPMVVGAAPIIVPDPVELERPAAAHPSTDPSRVCPTAEVKADASKEPVMSEPDLPPVPPPSTDPGRVERPNEVVADGTPGHKPAACDPDFLAAARLCTEFGRVDSTNELQPLLQEAARILDAMGLIVWVWDPLATELRPALAHGYSDKVLAQLPTVRPDADNATAAAFRSAQTRGITGSDRASGALVVPLLTPAGCAGVLAIEMQHGSEETRSMRAVATIFAAQLAQLIGDARPAAVRPKPEVTVPPGNFAPPILRTHMRR
ncbi:MAG: helix-turn-helix domain-containing protein [Acidobacteria bacterium]|nr:helix-turn-helix domain-containing protein [Acidobacteriota bacterium]